MKPSDWVALSKVLESPEPDVLMQILAASSHDDAHSLPGHDLGRKAVRALRRLATELTEASTARHQELSERLADMTADKEELEEILELGEHCRLAAKVVIPLPEDFLTSEEHTMTTHSALNDIHCGLRVREDTVLGLNEYSMDVLKLRMSLYVERTAKLIAKEMAHRAVTDHILWLLGDFIENELHGGSWAGAELYGPVEQSTAITGILGTALTRLRHLVPPQVRMKAVVLPGNHDRITRRMEHGRIYATSFAHAIGYGLQAQVPETIEVLRPTAGQTVVQTAQGYRVRGMHGHQFKYNNGIGGPEVPIRRAIPRLNKGVPADLTAMAHHHQTTTPGDFLISGPFCGVTPFTVEGTYEPRPAENLFWATDGHFGLAAIHRIKLDDV